MLRRLKRGDLKVNRNFLNYPLARDVRIAGDWNRRPLSGRWEHALTGISHIKFRMPAGATKLRCPSAFDMNVLFLYLRESLVRKKRKVEFKSTPALLKALRLDEINLSRNRVRLQEAFDLWSSISICYRQWYQPIKGKKGRRVPRVMPPPLTVIRSRPLLVEVDKEWRDLTRRGYWAPVRVPLPMQAAAQNLILLLLTSINRAKIDYDDPDWEHQLPRTIRGTCRSMGLNHSTRRAQFEAAIQLTIKWFAEEGVALDEAHRGGDIVFYFGPLKKIPRIRLKSERPDPVEGKPEYWTDDDGNHGWHKLVGDEWVDCGPLG